MKIVILLSCCLAASASHAATVTYTISGPDMPSIGYGINATGQMTGMASFGPQLTRAIVYDGTLTNLGSIGGNGSVGQAINSAGHVAGLDVAPGKPHAFLYDGTMHDLGTLAGDWSWAMGINDHDHVVGYSSHAGGGRHAFLYDGTMHDLGTLGGEMSTATGINNNGQVTGYSQLNDGTTTRAFIYDGTMIDIGTLGGSNSIGSAINALGVVTGSSAIAGDTVHHAFLYDGAFHDLGTLGTNSYGNAINNHNHVVGTSFVTDSVDSRRAFLFDGTQMIDLNTRIDSSSGWTLLDANGINDKGQIVGMGRFAGENRAFILTPIPEPSSFAIAALGLAGLGASGWRRKPLECR